MQGDIGRCREMQGDVGRYMEVYLGGEDPGALDREDDVVLDLARVGVRVRVRVRVGVRVRGSVSVSVRVYVCN